MDSLLSLTVVALLCGHCTASPFSAGQEYTYSYHAVVRGGTLVPVQTASHWEIKGKLHIQGGISAAVVQLANVTTSAYNGFGSIYHVPENHHVELPEAAAELLLPFTVHYSDGKVTGLTTSPGDHLWSVNIKKSLGSILQLNPSLLEKTVATVEEELLHGHCTVEYSIQPGQEGVVNIRKFVDHKSCSGFPSYAWTNTPPVVCPTEVKNPIWSDSVRFYTAVPVSETQLKILNLTAMGGLYVQSFQDQGEVHYSFTNQTLVLEAEGGVGSLMAVPGGGEHVGLLYQLPARGDLTQGRATVSQGQLLSWLGSTLNQISGSLEGPFEWTDTQVLHDERLSWAVDLLSVMTKLTLEDYFEDIAVGTSYHQETVRGLFLRLLPQVGTDDTVLFIRDLVLHRKVKNSTCVELLTTLPFYIRHPSEHLLDSFEEVLSLIEEFNDEMKQVVVLSFSTMVYKTCQNNCSPETLDKHIGRYFGWFAKSSEYSQQMLFLGGLSNIKLGNVFDYLEPVIRGNVSTLCESSNNNIRSLAVWASMNSVTRHPDKAFLLYWPVFVNSSEHLEMRVAALTMLILSKPTPGRFLSIFWQMESEDKGSHLYHFYYTTLQSLLDTKYPCYKPLGAMARQVFRITTPPTKRQWATGNYIIDYLDDQRGLGSLANLIMVGNARTGLPNVFYLMFSNHVQGKSQNLLSFYLKFEGLFGSLKQHHLKIDADTLKIPQLLEILKQLKIQPIKSEKVHIELLLKYDGHIIRSFYINQTNFDHMLKVLMDIKSIQTGVHLNYQHVLVPQFYEGIQPTDLGTPIILRYSSTSLTSVRGSFTQETFQQKISRSNQLDIRSYWNSLKRLSMYNPILNMWHGVQKSTGFQLHLPVNSQLSFNLMDQTLKFILKKAPVTGVSAHTDSHVFVRGAKAEQKLKSTCSTCKRLHTASRGIKEDLVSFTVEDIGMTLESSVFDCEHAHITNKATEFLYEVFDHRNKNYQIFPLSLPLLALLQLSDFISHVPPNGNCGIYLKLTSDPAQDSELEGTVCIKLEPHKLGPLPEARNHFQFTLHHQLANVTTPLQTWVVDAVHECSHGLTKHDLNLTVSRKSAEDGFHKLCLEMEARFPEGSIDPIAVAPSGPVTASLGVVWGRLEEAMVQQCPLSGASLQVSMRAEVSEEQQVLADKAVDWPYRDCRTDKHNAVEWGPNWTPHTDACVQASIELANLRKYSAVIRSNNLPYHLQRGWQLVTTARSSINASDSSLTLGLSISASNQTVSVTVNGQRAALGFAKPWIEPFMVNTRFPSGIRLANNLRFINWCILSSSQVKTLDGRTLNTQIPTGYSLAAADCTENPRFALLVKKVSGPKPLALKMYIGGQFVEVVPSEQEEFTISVNETVVGSAKDSYQHPQDEQSYSFKIWQHGGMVYLDSRLSHTWINYNGYTVVLTILGMYHGELCGLCGDSNNVAGNDMGILYTLE